ncbi:glycosyltransferase family 25 protein [Primorskyibacter sp. S87]|uniref:glycosyltransferase family 25 protein n=1 Tax=Primorskyibacter sp. S87 TaxID=3415126 RepID=UPI003C7A0C27
MNGDSKRAPNAAHLKAVLPDAEIMDAVIGRDVLANGGVDLRSGNLHHPSYPFSLGPGEVGCFLSHRRCWQRIVDGNLEFALIVEDDLAVSEPGWSDALALVMAHASVESFIRLPAKKREKPVMMVAQQGASRLFLPRHIGLQTVAQVVGRNAAARLLAASEVIDRPVDTFLQMHWATNQQVHTILPNGVTEITDELGGSTIQKKSRANGKLAREIKRAAYRAQVSLRPQKP